MPFYVFKIDRAFFGARARADRDDLDRTAATRGQRVTLAGNLVDDGGTDRTQPGDADFQCLIAHSLSETRPLFGIVRASATMERLRLPALAPRRERNDVVQFFRPGFKEAAHVAGGLADALLVLHERDAHKAFAILAKADAGRDGKLGLLHQES